MVCVGNGALRSHVAGFLMGNLTSANQEIEGIISKCQHQLFQEDLTF